MPRNPDKPSKAELFMQHAVSSNANKPMSEDPDARDIKSSVMAEGQGAENPSRADFSDVDELTTPGQLMDAIYALLIDQMEHLQRVVSRLEARVDLLLGMAVENHWIETPVTEEMLDDMAEERLKLLNKEQVYDKQRTEQPERTGNQRAYRREPRTGQSGGLGYVVRAEEDSEEPGDAD